MEAKELSHQDVTGVGYGICTFHPGGKDENRHFLDTYLADMEDRLSRQREKSDAYVKRARASLESYITQQKVLKIPQDLPEEMIKEKAGVFVSIHKHGKLRGCIGTIEPTRKCIAKEIIENAISASTRDPRFDPITEEELKWLEINVDVLGKPERIASRKELDVKKYGVIVSSGYRRGLLLPDIEGVDTVDQQVAIAMQKGGIREGEKYTLERFEVIRHI